MQTFSWSNSSKWRLQLCSSLFLWYFHFVMLVSFNWNHFISNLGSINYTNNNLSTFFRNHCWWQWQTKCSIWRWCGFKIFQYWFWQYLSWRGKSEEHICNYFSILKCHFLFNNKNKMFLGSWNSPWNNFGKSWYRIFTRLSWHWKTEHYYGQIGM